MSFKLRANQTVLTLMNKERPVVRFAYDLESHSAVKVLEVLDAAYAPPSVLDAHGRIDRGSINRWWRSRSIPASRDQFKDLIESLDVSSGLELAERSFGLSLSDRYWVNDAREPKEWAEINFFDNDFTEDLGLITLGQSSTPIPVDLFSPNSTVGGNLLKKWTIIEGRRCLVKAGSGLFNQEPYNEVAATALHKRLLDKEAYVPYTLLSQDRKVYSCCPNMLREDEELVCARDMIPRWKGQPRAEEVSGLVELYSSLGIGDARRRIDEMIACDFLIANSDRHYGNFGLIRDCETLRYKRVAPLFDSGRSLWCTSQVLDLPGDYGYVAKPFGYAGTPSNEVPELISDLSWLDPSRLSGFDEEVREILGRNPLMPTTRIDRVLTGVRENIKALVHRRAELTPISMATRDLDLGVDLEEAASLGEEAEGSRGDAIDCR